MLCARGSWHCGIWGSPDPSCCSISSAHHPCRVWGVWDGSVFVVPTRSWDMWCFGNASQLAVLEESCPVSGESLLGRVTPGRALLVLTPPPGLLWLFG